jgi:hypothetical protein
MPFRGFACGRKACRSIGAACGRFVDYLLLLSFWRSVKNCAVLTSLKKASKEQGRIEVKILTSKQLNKIFETERAQG